MRASTVYAVIAILTFGVFSTVNTHDFVMYGDRATILFNPHVTPGLEAETVGWAFEIANGSAWQPLAWISLQASQDAYGLAKPGPWLITQLALHVVASLLLLFALTRLTLRFWPSAFVASVYALHPLQVEIVAWATARSEALAGVLLAATLAAWVGWVEKPSVARYAAVLLAATLGTLAGPGFLALPFALLLLDVWPLGRLAAGGERSGRFAAEPAPTLARLLGEKAPLCVIGAAGALARQASASVMSNPWSVDPSLGARLAAAPVNLVDAAARVLWPSSLAFTHPTSAQMGLGDPPLWQVVLALALLVAPLLVAPRLGARGRPWAVGWSWFIVFALPSCGLVPSGLRMLQDRDLQFALVGIAIAVAFPAASLLERVPRRELVASLSAGLVLVVLASAARVQAHTWRDSAALFDHALALNDRDAMAFYYKGMLLMEGGFDTAGIGQLKRAVEISPDLVHANLALGAIMADRGQPELAIEHLRLALPGLPRSAEVRTRLAQALLAAGDAEGALAVLDDARKRMPDSAQLQIESGRVHEATGNVERAERAYRAALALDPSSGVARARLASIERAKARAAAGLAAGSDGPGAPGPDAGGAADGAAH